MRPVLLRRRVLASSARRYAAAGWPVAAGAWWDGARYRCSTTPCQVAGHHPAGHRPPAGTCSTDPAEVAAWWATLPHTVILPTGLVHDVLDVTATHGLAAWQQLHRSGMHVPTARTPTGRLLLFVAAAAEPRPALPEPADTGMIYHGLGSYVIAPPSTVQHGRVGWVRAPWVDQWALPQPQPVLHALARATADAPMPDNPPRYAAPVGDHVLSGSGPGRHQRPAQQWRRTTPSLLAPRRTR